MHGGRFRDIVADEIDKGVDAAAKRSGHGMNASTTEKVSDGIRSAFKKVRPRPRV
jgi:hypothetical protein